MTDPLFLLPDGALADVVPGGLVTLDGDEGRHAATVRRIRVGEHLDVADGTGRTASCTVEEARKDALVLRVGSVAEAEQRLPRLELVQALAKGGRDEAAVETATELGVDAVVPWEAARSVVRWSGERREKHRLRWVATVRAAVKQSRRPTVPQVAGPVTTADLARLVGQVTAGGGVVLVLHEDAAEPLTTTPLTSTPPTTPLPTTPLATTQLSAEHRVVVVVGPEGGIGPEELDALVAAGARAVRLGPEVLRTSSAGPAALAVLSARLGRWG